jgi:hypothetical protein
MMFNLDKLSEQEKKKARLALALILLLPFLLGIFSGIVLMKIFTAYERNLFLGTAHVQRMRLCDWRSLLVLQATLGRYSEVA